MHIESEVQRHEKHCYLPKFKGDCFLENYYIKEGENYSHPLATYFYDLKISL